MLPLLLESFIAHVLRTRGLFRKPSIRTEGARGLHTLKTSIETSPITIAQTTGHSCVCVSQAKWLLRPHRFPHAELLSSSGLRLLNAHAGMLKMLRVCSSSVIGSRNHSAARVITALVRQCRLWGLHAVCIAPHP